MDMMLVIAFVAFLLLIFAWLALPAGAPSREPIRVSISRRSAAEA